MTSRLQAIATHHTLLAVLRRQDRNLTTRLTGYPVNEGTLQLINDARQLHGCIIYITSRPYVYSRWNDLTIRLHTMSLNRWLNRIVVIERRLNEYEVRRTELALVAVAESSDILNQQGQPEHQ